MNVDFFFDPICPWCWITSRWITEVKDQRDLTVTWRAFSLYEKNRESLKPEYEDRMRASHGALRVAESVRASEGESAVAAYYTELGARIHNDKAPVDTLDLADVLATAGVPASHATAATEEKWDAALTASMAEALERAGHDVGVPLISIEGKRAYFGPVMTPAPHGDEALELWDAIATLSTMKGFFELKNASRAVLEFAPRPEVPVASH